MEIKSNSIEIDTITVNYSDSAVSDNLKLNLYTGIGEKRIYIKTVTSPGNLDEFFFRHTNGICYILKDDLFIYLRDAYYEYHFPTQDYKNNIREYYNSLLSMVKSLPEKIEISFTKTHDSRNRYYLVCERAYRDNLRVLSEICLPQITKLSFVRFYDTINHETHIQLRPFFYRTDLTGSNHPNFYQSSFTQQDISVISSIEDESIEVIEVEKPVTIEHIEPTVKQQRSNDRPWQSDWKNKVLDETMHCAITKCSDDRILIGCHIKPVADCIKEACGNEINSKNGIMLTPTFHKLFDDGFLAFDNQNHLLLSTHISSRNFDRLNIRNNQVTSILDLNPRVEFLEWHRKMVFKG
jgi:putative restriction endonuclease